MGKDIDGNDVTDGDVLFQPRADLYDDSYNTEPIAVLDSGESIFKGRGSQVTDTDRSVCEQHQWIRIRDCERMPSWVKEVVERGKVVSYYPEKGALIKCAMCYEEKELFSGQ